MRKRVLPATLVALLLIGCQAGATPKKLPSYEAPIAVTAYEPTLKPSYVPATEAPKITLQPSSSAAASTDAPGSGAPQVTPGAPGATVTATPSPTPEIKGKIVAVPTTVKLDSAWKVVFTGFPTTSVAILQSITYPDSKLVKRGVRYELKTDPTEVPFNFPSKNADSTPFTPAWNPGLYTFLFTVGERTYNVNVTLQK